MVMSKDQLQFSLEEAPRMVINPVAVEVLVNELKVAKKATSSCYPKAKK